MRIMLGVLLLGALLAVPVQAVELSLRVMSRTGQSQAYYHALLVLALAQQGVKVKLSEAPDMPNARAEPLLESGQLDVHWFIRTPARDRRFLLVAHPLTDGLIGWRIPMVRAANAEAYAKLRTLADWQRSGKVAAMGFGWADAGIWQHNRLPEAQQRLTVPDLYRLVASGNRGVDYFPRGSIEVGLEQDMRAGLVPAPGVVLVYPQDFYFYVSPARPQLQNLLQKALQQAEQSGLRHSLFQRHYGAGLAELALASRQVIQLKLPAAD